MVTASVSGSNTFGALCEIIAGACTADSTSSSSNSSGVVFPAKAGVMQGDSTSSGRMGVVKIQITSGELPGNSQSSDAITYLLWRMPYFEGDTLVIEYAVAAEMNNDVLEVT